MFSVPVQNTEVCRRELSPWLVLVIREVDKVEITENGFDLRDASEVILQCRFSRAIL
jgi:hypothetical protein